MTVRRMLGLALLVVFAAASPLQAQLFQSGETKRSSVKIVALAKVTVPDKKSYGVVAPVDITVGGVKAGQVRIGFFEPAAGAAGPMWRSAGWSASLVAAQLTDFDPRTMQVGYDIPFAIDGPSAGCLMTIGVTAAARGDKIRPDATMTGTITPDGAVGPVGGISYKIDAAAANGKKLVLIPAGLRFDDDPDRDGRIDLVEHGRKLGVEVKQVIDVWTAYKHLTGSELPRAEAAEPPELSKQAIDIVEKRTNVWRERYHAARHAITQLDQASIGEFAVPLIKEGEKSKQSAEDLLKSGDFVAAFDDMLWGAVSSYAAMEVARCNHTYLRGGIDAVVRRTRNNGWLQTEVERVATAFRYFRPTTLDQLSVYLHACEAFSSGLAYQKLAGFYLDNLGGSEEEQAEMTYKASIYQITSWLNLKLAIDYLEAANLFRGGEIKNPQRAAGMANFYLRAAKANLDFFEAFLTRQAQSANVSALQLKLELIQTDESYAVLTTMLNHVNPTFGDHFGDGEQRGYAALAQAIAMYSRSSMLVAAYYSLNAEHDEEHNIVRLRRERAFAQWLDMSEDQTRRAIQQLKEDGIDTTVCTMFYNSARVSKGRGLDDRLEALFSYFIANVTATALRQMAR